MSPTPGKSKTDEVIEVAGRIALLTGRIGAPYVSAAMDVTKLLVSFFNRNKASGEPELAIDDKVAIQKFIDTARLGREEGQAILARWERDAQAAGGGVVEDEKE